MKKKHYVLVVGALVLLLLACSNNSPFKPDGTALTWSEFPHTVGLEWSYRIESQLNECPLCYDTVDISLFDSAKYRDGSTHYSFEFTYPTRIDTSYMIYRYDTLSLPEDFGGFWMPLPVELGANWGILSIGHVVAMVKSISTVTVPAGSFENAFRVVVDAQYLDTWVRAVIWIAPDVGIIKYHFMLDGMTTPRNEVWELISYQLP